MTSPTSRAVVERFLAAANAHEVEAAISCLGDGFECRGADGLRLDREQLRVWLGWEVVMRYRYELSEVVDLGESLTALMTEKSDLYTLLGMEPQRVRLRFEVGGQLIQLQEFELMPRGPSLTQALRPFLNWIDRTRPQALAGVRRDDTPVFDRASAERWLPLIQKWRESRPEASATS